VTSPPRFKSQNHISMTPVRKVLTGKHILWYKAVIVQVASCWLHTAAAWVQSQVMSCEICGGQSENAAVLQFSLPIVIPLTAAYSSIIQGWYNAGTSFSLEQHTRSILHWSQIVTNPLGN
jgi:hypothetical protein